MAREVFQAVQAAENKADQLIQVFWAQYRTLKPHGKLREFYANVNEWQFWNFGGEFIGRAQTAMSI